MKEETKSEGILEIENIGKRTETTYANINTIQGIQERILGVEHKIEETDSSVKENVQFLKFLKQTTRTSGIQ